MYTQKIHTRTHTHTHAYAHKDTHFAHKRHADTHVRRHKTLAYSFTHTCVYTQIYVIACNADKLWRRPAKSVKYIPSASCIEYSNARIRNLQSN
jgi:hypothetical protein